MASWREIERVRKIVRGRAITPALTSTKIVRTRERSDSWIRRVGRLTARAWALHLVELA